MKRDRVVLLIYVQPNRLLCVILWMYCIYLVLCDLILLLWQQKCESIKTDADVIRAQSDSWFYHVCAG